MRYLIVFGFAVMFVMTALPAWSLTDEEANDLVNEIKMLRQEVGELKGLVGELEGPKDASREAGESDDNLPPVPEEAIGGDITASALTGEIGRPTSSQQGVQAQIGVVFDGTIMARSENSDRADVREVELNIGAPVDHYFDLFAQIAFTPEEVELEQAYATVRLPWNFQGKVGKERIPFGELNKFDGDAYPQVDRPHVMKNFMGEEGTNEMGGHLEWIAPFATNPTLSLLAGVYNGANGTDGDGDGIPDGPFSGRAGDRGPLLFGRATSFIEWDEARHEARVGGSLLTDKNDVSGRTRSDLWGADLKYRWTPDATGRGVILGAEYLRHKREELPTTTFLANAGRDMTSDGFYLYGQYDFNRRWGAGYRYGQSEQLFSQINEIKAHSLYGEWRPSEFSRLRLQYRKDNRNFDANVIGDRSDDDEHLLMLQGTYFIGWHPTHAF